MQRTTAFLAILLMVAVVLWAGNDDKPAYQTDLDAILAHYQAPSLHGIEEMYVTVGGGVLDNKPVGGYDRNAMQDAVGHRLKDIGIGVVAPDPKNSRIIPMIIVMPMVMRTGNGKIAYWLRISVRDEIKVANRPTVTTSGDIWSYGLMGQCNEDDFEKKARNAVMDVLNAFSKDYLRANPKH